MPPHRLLMHCTTLVVALVLVGCGGGGGGGGSSSSGGAGATVPTIRMQPASTTVAPGQTAVFSVGATGSGTLTYQWKRSGTAISGATAASYLTPTVGTLDSGATFSVVVTDSAGSVASAAATLTVTPPTGGADVLMWHNDPARTGQNLGETTLTPANVSVASFGLKSSLTLDGHVDAQPLYAAQVTVAGAPHNLLIVGTENGTLYAFDADAAATTPVPAPLWHVNLIPSGQVPQNDRYGNNQITPTIGITATPIIDRTQGPNGTIYVVVASMLVSTTTTYFQYLHAIDLATGADRMAPTSIMAAYTCTPSPCMGDNNVGTNGAVVFDAGMYKERTALVLANGVIYTMWAALGTPACTSSSPPGCVEGDQRPYTGFIIGYNETTLAQAQVLDITPNSFGGAAWASGAGAAVDAAGNLYYMVANGTFDVTLTASSFPSLGDYGNAFLKLSAASGGLEVVDYFEATDGPANSAADKDQGSGGLILLPPQIDATGVERQLAVGAGKDGNIYVVDQGNLGKYNSSVNLNYQVVSNALVGPNYGVVFSTPAWFNGTVYYGAAADSIKAFFMTGAKMPTTATQASPTAFAAPGATPSISANGLSNPIVWALENNAAGCVLHAFDANNLTRELYSNLNSARDGIPGSNSKYLTPTITAGKVFVGTTTGVSIFGLL